MKTMTLKKPTPQGQKDIRLYHVAGRLIAVRPETNPTPVPVVPERKFLGTVTSHSGKLSVTDPTDSLLEDSLTLTPGLGEGTYEAYATLQHIPGHGERITKIEMEFIPNWELTQYERLEALGDTLC